MKIIDLFENVNQSKDDKAVEQLKIALLAQKDKIESFKDDDKVYHFIDRLMTRICKVYGLSPKKLHDMWVKKYKEIPDTWIMHQKRTKS